MSVFSSSARRFIFEIMNRRKYLTRFIYFMKNNNSVTVYIISAYSCIIRIILVFIHINFEKYKLMIFF